MEELHVTDGGENLDKETVSYRKVTIRYSHSFNGTSGSLSIIRVSKQIYSRKPTHDIKRGH